MNIWPVYLRAPMPKVAPSFPCLQVKVAQARAEMSAANERARELEAQLQDMTGALAVAEQQLHHRDTDAKAAVMELEAALEDAREALENERACGDQKAKVRLPGCIHYGLRTS